MRLARTALTLPVLGAVTLGIVAHPVPAQALSCIPPEAVYAQATSAFTGVIVDARGGNLVVDVAEVWKGAPVPGRVTLRVELAGWSVWINDQGLIPDGYSAPGTWLFVPSEAGTTINPCTAWNADQAGVGELRPTTVVEAAVPDPAGPGDDLGAVGAGDAVDAVEVVDSSPSWLVGGGIGLAALAACLGYLVVRRGRRSSSSS